MKIMIKSYSLYMDRTRSPCWPRVTKVSEAGGSKRQCPSVLVLGWWWLAGSFSGPVSARFTQYLHTRRCQCASASARVLAVV